MANLRNGDFTKLGRFHNFCYIFDIDLLLGIFCSKRTSLVLSGRSRHSAPCLFFLLVRSLIIGWNFWVCKPLECLKPGAKLKGGHSRPESTKNLQKPLRNSHSAEKPFSPNIDFWLRLNQHAWIEVRVWYKTSFCSRNQLWTLCPTVLVSS